MRISDWSSDVCSSDLDTVPASNVQGCIGRLQHAQVEPSGASLAAIDGGLDGNIDLERGSGTGAEAEGVTDGELALCDVELALPASPGGVAEIGWGEVGGRRDCAVATGGDSNRGGARRALAEDPPTAIETDHAWGFGALLGAD